MDAPVGYGCLAGWPVGPYGLGLSGLKSCMRCKNNPANKRLGFSYHRALNLKLSLLPTARLTGTVQYAGTSAHPRQPSQATQKEKEKEKEIG